MIRLKNLIKETSITDRSIVLDLSLQGKIYRSANALYRGIDAPNVSVGPHTVNKNRMPRDTHIMIDVLLEIYRLEKYPDMPSRRQTVFCSPSIKNAADYAGKKGGVYEIFPYKPYKIYSYINKRDKDSIELLQRYSLIAGYKRAGGAIGNLIDKNEAKIPDKSERMEILNIMGSLDPASGPRKLLDIFDEYFDSLEDITNSIENMEHYQFSRIGEIHVLCDEYYCLHAQDDYDQDDDDL